MALILRQLPIEVPTRKRATLAMSPELLVRLCQPTLRPHYFVVAENPLPADAEIVGVSFDGRLVTLTVQSAYFGDVPESEPYPELPSPVFREIVIEQED